MSWQPISVYDKAKKKLDYCVFYFEESDIGGRNFLVPTVQTTRRYGVRVCTHFYQVGLPPEAPYEPSKRL